jgi:hypothetical protein
MAEYAILTAEQGTDTTFQIDVVDANRNPRDLDGMSVAAKFRKAFNSNIVYEFEDSIATPTTDGIIKLHLDASFTNTIDAGRYFYDVELTTTTNTTERITEGILELTPAVTQSARAFKASTRLIPVQLGDLTDVNATASDGQALTFDSDTQSFVFTAASGLVDSDFILQTADSNHIRSAVDANYITSLGVVGTDSDAVFNLIDSDYIRTVYTAGANVSIDSAGVISAVTGQVDSDDLESILANPDFEIDGGTF